MKTKVMSIALTLIALFTFSAAQAQNAHFTDVVVSEDGLTITGKIAGLGKAYTGQTVTITYGAEVTVTKECLNRNGKVVPGQSGTQHVSTTKQVTVTAKNGHVNFELTLDGMTVPTADCAAGLVQGTSSASSEAGPKTLSFSVGSASGTMEL